MRKNLIAQFFILSCITFAFCKKAADITDTTENQQQEDITKSFLKDVKSDNPGDYYISGEFDGHKIYLASTLGEYYPYNDTGMNALYLNASIKLDNIHLVRENRDMTAMLAIYFDQANIFNRSFPYVLPHPNLAQCEAAQMELINMKKLGTAGQGSATDDFSFFGHSNENIKVQVTSFENNIMEGTFEGSLSTKTGSTVKVRNGKYRIKILVVNMGNK